MEEPTFADLGLRESFLVTLSNLGYEAPTPIQQRTIPALLAGRDVIGQAQTGTGKTAAFALPMLEKIDLQRRETQALVLTPTRELAMQVAEAIHSYGHGMTGLSVLPVYGGAPIVPQLKRLERGVQIVVGTPGRLIDVLDRKTLRLDSIRVMVVDEADEMLKMGFIDDVEKLLSAAPATRQIALFSATMPPEVLRIAQRHLVNAERIEVERKAVAAPAIEQRFLNVSEPQKLEALMQMLELEEYDAVLIFRRTKNGAAELAERLEGRGFAALAMHGDMKQSERESVIRRLKAGQVEIVVATDVAARGLDVEQISHVINYDIPNDVEAYVHRIGRTGRAGRSGIAILFITPRERKMMREIERFTGSSIKPMKMPTRADVAARRVTQLKDTIRKTISEGDLDLYVELVEQLVEEGTHDLAEIAAAAARLASTARPIAVDDERRETAAPMEPERPQRHGAAAERPRPAANAREGFRRDTAGADASKVRLRMDVGKREGVRPADVVGSIANEAGIAGRDIGPIDIRDDVTYVSVPADAADLVISKVAGARFRGHAVNLRVAGGGEEVSRPRREDDTSGERPARAARPRGDRPDRPPRREFGDRGSGAGAPRRSAPARSGSGFRGDTAPRPGYGARRDAAPRSGYGARRDAAPRGAARSAGPPAARRSFEDRPPRDTSRTPGAFSRFARKPSGSSRPPRPGAGGRGKKR